jgi:hypothetical protein
MRSLTEYTACRPRGPFVSTPQPDHDAEVGGEEDHDGDLKPEHLILVELGTDDAVELVELPRLLLDAGATLGEVPVPGAGIISRAKKKGTFIFTGLGRPPKPKLDEAK